MAFISLLLYPLVPLAYLSLWLFGWELLTPQYIEAFKKHQKKVVIFPHTTYWDFPILAAYSLTAWSQYQHEQIYIIIKPSYINGYFGWFFRAFNCIPATPKDQQGHGFVDRTVSQFKGQERFTIFISPEGTTSLSKWKTGYFYLAQRLNCPIQVVGLDYHTHSPVIQEPIFPSYLSLTQQLLEGQISTIPTLHPEQSVVATPYVETSLCDPGRMIIVSSWLIFVAILGLGSGWWLPFGIFLLNVLACIGLFG